MSETFETLRQKIAELEWQLSRSDTALEIIENDISRCHQCSSEYERTLSRRMEQWDAENPQPAALQAREVQP